MAVLVVGALVTTLVSASFQRRADAEVDTILTARAREAVEVIDARVSRAFDAGIAVRSLIELRPDLTEEEFLTFAVDGGLLAAHPRLTAVSFARYAPASEAADLVERLREGGVEVSPPPEAGQDVIAVEVLAPLEGNEAAYGLNLFFDERRADAILRARDRGTNTLTAPLNLVQDGEDRVSLLLFVPIYDADDPPSTGPERRRSFVGVGTSVARVERLFDGLVGPNPIIDLEIADVGTLGEPEAEPSLLLRFGDPITEGVPLDHTVGDRRWRITVAPNDRFPSGEDATGIARGAGIGLTIALALLIVTLATARARAEALVERRTAELSDANRELVEANQAKSTFLSTVSHELRTPLTAIMGFVALLRERQGVDEAMREDMLLRVDRNAQSLHGLIEELLAFSRLEDGGPLHRIDVDLSEVVGRSLENLESVLNTIDLETDLPRGVRVKADPQAVDRIVGNLVTNAAKYGGAGVAVRVSVRPEAEHAVIEVHDDGRGIAPEDHERVFEQFERGDNHTTVPGTGIGLAVVRGLARRHGGDVGLVSAPGQGATFTVRLARSGAVLPQATSGDQSAADRAR